MNMKLNVKIKKLGKALKKPSPSFNYSLTKDEARILKINSGITKARKIIQSTRLSKEDVIKIKEFYCKIKK